MTNTSPTDRDDTASNDNTHPHDNNFIPQATNEPQDDANTTPSPPTILIVSNYTPPQPFFNRTLDTARDTLNASNATLLTFDATVTTPPVDSEVKTPANAYANSRTTTTNEHSINDNDDAVVVTNEPDDCVTITAVTTDMIPCTPEYALPFAEHLVLIEHVVSPDTPSEPTILDSWFTHGNKQLGSDNVSFALTHSL